MEDIDQTRPERMSAWAGMALVNFSTFGWATNLIVARLVNQDVGPISLSALRFSLASVVFLLLMLRLPPAERRLGRDVWLLLGMALSGMVIFSPLLYWGLYYTTAANAALINGTAPLLTAIWAVWLIREPMTRPQMVGAVLALVGIVVLVSGGSLSYLLDFKVNFGDVLVLAAVAFWGIYSVLGRWVMKRSGRSPVSVTAFSIILSLPFLWAGAGWEMQYLPVVFSPRMITAIVYISLVPAGLCMLSWNAGVRRLGASGAMIFYNTLPLYGAALGALVLGEPLGLVHVAGGLLVIAGGLWAARHA